MCANQSHDLSRYTWEVTLAFLQHGAYQLPLLYADYKTPIGRKKDLISMYRGTPVGAFVNILDYFNKLANNF